LIVTLCACPAYLYPVLAATARRATTPARPVNKAPDNWAAKPPKLVVFP
jgi:hypothetical protein